MKRFLAILLLLLATRSVGAQTIQFLAQRQFTATSATADVGLAMSSSGVAWHQISWVLTGGTLSGCSVKLQQSSDNATWSDLIAAQTCTSNGQSSATNVVASYVRINVTVFTQSAGTPSLAVSYFGYSNNPVNGGGAGTITATSSTANILTKFTGATSIGNSAVSDNGTTVTSAEPFVVSPGGSSAPQVSFTESTNPCGIATSGVDIFCFNSTLGGQWSIKGGAFTTPAGIGTDLGGTNPATTVTGFHFGATSTPLSSTAPSTNQFLKWDGTNIVGATPSGTLPGGAANGNILGVSGGSAAWITTQNLTAKSPSIDPTGSGINSGSPAKCDGSTNDQAALQSVLNTISTNGGGSLRVPNTGSPCLSNDVFYQVITAISSGVPSGTSSCTSAPYCIATATATVASTTGLPPDNAGLVYIDNIPVGSGGTNYNGIFIITGHTGTTFTFQVSSTAGSGDTATPTANSVATVGLYYLGNNLKFDASCAAGNASTCSAFKTTGHAPILMTYTPNGDHSGPDIRNVSFIGAATTFAGIIVGNTNKFRLDDNAFSGFTGASGPAAASPWGGVNIGTISGSQCNIVSVCLVSNPWVQFGSIKFNQWGGNLGFSSRGLLSSAIIEGNTTQQANGVNIGTDIGGLQFLNYGNWNPINGGSPDLSGGENFVINDQVQGAAIGALFGGQNNDRIFLKAELNGAGVNRCNHALGSAELCSFGLAIMDTLNSTIFDQSKQLSMGWYIDALSPGNNVYETNVGGALGTGAAITAASITSNVLTITHASDTSTFAGNSIVLTGTAESFLNNQTVIVLSAGLTSTQFTANFTHANFTNASDTGNITQNAAPTLLSLCSGWNSAAPMTSTCSALTPNYSFQAASNMVDPAVAASTNVYGTIPSGAFTPTLNSTFVGNQDAASVTFQQGFTALAVANFNADAVVNSTGVATGSLPALPSGSILNVVNNSTTRATVGAFGNSGRFSTLAAGGTASSPTAVGTTTEVGRFDMFAYNGAAYNPLGGWRMVTHQAQTGSNGGSTLIAQTAPDGTIVPADVLRIENDGGITTQGVTGGDQGAGTINAGGLFVNGAAVAGSVSGTAPVGVSGGVISVSGNGAGTVQTARLNDTNANQWLGETPTASAVDFFNITNGATGTPGTVTVGPAGTDAAITLKFVGKGAGTGQFLFNPGSGNDSTSAFQIQNAGASTTPLTVDTTNNRVCIACSTGPIASLDVGGKFNIGVASGNISKSNNTATIGIGAPFFLGAAVNLTTSTSSASQTLHSNIPAAGDYLITYYADPNVGTCSVLGGGGVTFQFAWTDVADARTLTTASMPLVTAETATSYLQGTVMIHATATSTVTVTPTFTQCGTGAGSYDLHAILQRIQ